jgi:hypothetical protein
MANTNTVAAAYNLTGPTSSTETCIAASGSTTQRALVAVRPDIIGGAGLFDGHPFKLRVVSKAVASGACNFTVNVYLNLANNTGLTTLTSDVLVIGSGAQALASVSGALYMEAKLLWDSTAGRLAGHWMDGAGLSNIVTTPAVIKTSGAVTGTNPLSASAITSTGLMSFYVTHTMSANATSSTLVELANDQI